jgi:hypothetical protein
MTNAGVGDAGATNSPDRTVALFLTRRSSASVAFSRTYFRHRGTGGDTALPVCCGYPPSNRTSVFGIAVWAGVFSARRGSLITRGPSTLLARRVAFKVSRTDPLPLEARSPASGSSNQARNAIYCLLNDWPGCIPASYAAFMRTILLALLIRYARNTGQSRRAPLVDP